MAVPEDRPALEDQHVAGRRRRSDREADDARLRGRPRGDLSPLGALGPAEELDGALGQRDAASPEQADERLEFARGRAADARKALTDDSRGKAAVQLQAAEAAADQAESLLDGVEHMEAELTRASSALPTALREIDADIAEANALLRRPYRAPWKHPEPGAV